MLKKYKLDDDTIAYTSLGYDYGIASDDSHHFKEPYISVTRDPNGGYPSFTVREGSLKEITYPLEDRPPGDFKLCGIGLGEKCCIFLTVSGEGFCCEKNRSLHGQLVTKSKTMSAKRIPEALYPDCQLTEIEMKEK